MVITGSLGVLFLFSLHPLIVNRFTTVKQGHNEQRPPLCFVLGLCFEGKLLLLELLLMCVIANNLFIIKCTVIEVYLDTFKMHLPSKI